MRTLLTLFMVVVAVITISAPAAAYPIRGSYDGFPIQNCPDPTITSEQGSDGLTHWYMFCTSDPLNDVDRQSDGSYAFHLIPMLHSTDLVIWDYVGDVFETQPSWVVAAIGPDAGLWAPDIQFFNGQWYLYYTAAQGTFGDASPHVSAIGVATSPSPSGPWTDSGAPVVEPQLSRWVYDPFVFQKENGQRYIFYGGYVGGISARELSADGFTSDALTETQITVANRYEGTFIVRRGEYYYLLVSASNCCNTELTGYSVFVGRSPDLLGPYVDREGVSLLESRVGGTPVISMNGNRWVGPGHNSVVTDFAGQDWFVYHAVNRDDPHFAGFSTFTKRAAMLDPLDWIDGWPTVRGGLWASEASPIDDPNTPQPAAQPGQETRYAFEQAVEDRPAELFLSFSDDFESSR